jgi:phosphate transport system permease protein
MGHPAPLDPEAIPSRPVATSPALDRSVISVRGLFDATASGFTVAATALAVVPLFAVVWSLFERGAGGLTATMFTEAPPPPGDEVGGFGNALAGTAVMVSIASAISVPIGLLAAIHLAEFARGARHADLVRFAAKVLTGMPSILAGVFAYALVVLTTGRFSAWAGGLALALLMLPTVLLTAEQAFLAVPPRIREAAVGMGCTGTQVVFKVVLPTALPSAITGVLLAVARAAGETAPLLFTALFSSYYGEWPFAEPTASLSVLIYNFAGVPYDNQLRLAWSASLVLVLAMLVVNSAGRALARRPYPE